MRKRVKSSLRRPSFFWCERALGSPSKNSRTFILFPVSPSSFLLYLFICSLILVFALFSLPWPILVPSLQLPSLVSFSFHHSSHFSPFLSFFFFILARVHLYFSFTHISVHHPCKLWKISDSWSFSRNHYLFNVFHGLMKLLFFCGIFLQTEFQSLL